MLVDYCARLLLIINDVSSLLDLHPDRQSASVPDLAVSLATVFQHCDQFTAIHVTIYVFCVLCHAAAAAAWASALKFILAMPQPMYIYRSKQARDIKQQS